MTGTPIDLGTWDRAQQYQFFRTFDRPHYATTVRMDVTRLMQARKTSGLSPFRHTVWSIGVGLHAVPQLCVRFQEDTILQFDRLILSSTVALDNGEYGYGYYPFQHDRATFDADCRRVMEEVRGKNGLNANDGSLHNIAYLSCLPWLDYTALDNALPHKDDCIPRISWGKIVEKDGRFDMAMTLQIHHALADGLHVAQFFEATGQALDRVA